MQATQSKTAPQLCMYTLNTFPKVVHGKRLQNGKNCPKMYKVPDPMAQMKKATISTKARKVCLHTNHIYIYIAITVVVYAYFFLYFLFIYDE